MGTNIYNRLRLTFPLKLTQKPYNSDSEQKQVTTYAVLTHFARNLWNHTSQIVLEPSTPNSPNR